MFDVGFSEMIVIGIVALIVIGPEKLPRVARTVGLLVGRMQRYVSNVKSDIQREMQFEDLQKLQQEIKQGLTDTHSEVQQAGAGIKEEVAALERDIESAVTGGSSLHAALATNTNAVQSELDLSVSPGADPNNAESVDADEQEAAASKPQLAALEMAPPLPASQELNTESPAAQDADDTASASALLSSVTDTSKPSEPKTSQPKTSQTKSSQS